MEHIHVFKIKVKTATAAGELIASLSIKGVVGEAEELTDGTFVVSVTGW